MIKVGSSYIRKFQFFEEIKDIEPTLNDQSLKNSININEKEEKKNEDSSISINNIFISSPKQMKVFENFIFISGQATHKKGGQMIRENLIMKIQNNKVIDEYFIFNLFYYDFFFKVFDFKPYFIVLGSSFCEIKKDVYTITKIKIYNGNDFLKEEKMNINPGYEKGLEPFPKSLIKEIKLLKRIGEDEIILEEGGEDMKSFEALQNINAFDFSANFIFAALSIDKGGIILIYGYPNLLECNNKDTIIKYLPLITNKDKEVIVTNIKFSELENDNKIILYVSTSNSIFYYIWNWDSQKNSYPENIQLKLLIQENLGGYNCRIQIKDSFLLIGNDKMIAEYNNLQLGQTWFFEGKKTIIDYFNDYIYYAIFGEEENSLQIYDKTNKFFIFQKANKNKILSICNDTNYIYIFYEETPNLKYIIKLKEKNNKEKFENFFQKKSFHDAIVYAKNLNFNEENISEISKKKAQYEFSKGHYDKSIEEYIKIIKYNEPSVIIQKFLEKSKFNFLIKYLEEIVENYASNNKDFEESKNYTTLLLHCYIMQEEISKLKKFIEDKGEIFSKDLIKTSIDVCVETNNEEIGLSIAKQYNMIYEYLHITLTRLNDYKEFIDIIENPEKFEFKINNKEKVELYLKFADYFLLNKNKEKEEEKKEEGKEKEEDYSDKFFNSVLAFIRGNKKNLDKKDIIKLIELFLDTDKFFISLFDSMTTYNLNYTKEIIHRRIQLYLEDYEKDKKNIDSKSYIISILKDKKYMQIYDRQYLIMLFKTSHFIEGIEVICEIDGNYQDLLTIYMQKKDFKKIINICKNFGSKELSFWGTSLNFFLNKEILKSMEPEEIEKFDEYLEEFLNTLLENNKITPVEILDILNEKKCNISYKILKKFMEKTLNNEISSVEDNKNSYNDYENKINTICNSLKEINTQGNIFNVSKCCECGDNIDLPYYAFYCGHSIHLSCLNMNNKEDNIECPKCKEEKNVLKTKIENLKKYEKDLTSLEKLENVLENKEEKMDFIYELYGKGFFNFQNMKEK